MGDTISLTAIQYYSRISGLMAAGLIIRNRGKYSLSCLGKVVYDVQLTIGRTLQYYWKLKAIESMQDSDISEQDS
jgi:predicted transcriptional regulator